MKSIIKDGSRRLPLFVLLSYKLKRSWGYESGFFDSRGAGYSRSTNIFTGDAWRSWAQPVSTGTMLPNFKR